MVCQTQNGLFMICKLWYFKERDGMIVDKMVEQCQMTGYPKLQPVGQRMAMLKFLV